MTSGSGSRVRTGVMERDSRWTDSGTARAGAAFLALAVTAVVAVSTARAEETSVSRLQVTADEFTLALSRTTIPRGIAVLELVNLGEDDHDLALRRVAKGARTLRVPVATPGALSSLEARLVAGRYRLWCTLAGHRARGMHASLVVRSR